MLPRHEPGGDRVTRAMRLPVALLAALSLVSACGQQATTSSPDATAAPTLSPVPSPSSSSSAAAVGDADAFVVTLPASGGVFSGALIVEAVAPDGRRVTVTTIPDVIAGLPDGTSILESEPIRVSPGGYLTVAVEGPFDGASGADDLVARRLIFDLHAPSRAPLVVPGGTPAWGPDGRLAISAATSVTFADPATGDRTSNVNPEGVDAADVWAADGSGLLASRYDGTTDSSTAGVLGLDGQFVAGARPSWPATGRDRPFGADGTFVSDALSEGPTGSEQSIVEQRAGQTTPLTWLVVHQPGSDPTILDHTWDAAGNGQWVALGTKDSVRLVHLSRPVGSKPVTPEDHATLEPTAGTIAGVAPDDSAVIMAAGGLESAMALFRVDTSTGASIHLENPAGLSSFAGWAARP